MRNIMYSYSYYFLLNVRVNTEKSSVDSEVSNLFNVLHFKSSYCHHFTCPCALLFCKDTFAQQSPQSPLLSIFPRQEINAGIHNGIELNVSAHTQSKADYKGLLDNSSDIQRVTYSSNGNTLNTTLWLGGVVKEIPSICGASTAAYGMLVDADNNSTVGKFGADYQKEFNGITKLKIGVTCLLSIHLQSILEL
jgi:hypothetical protein